MIIPSRIFLVKVIMTIIDIIVTTCTHTLLATYLRPALYINIIVTTCTHTLLATYLRPALYINIIVTTFTHTLLATYLRPALYINIIVITFTHTLLATYLRPALYIAFPQLSVTYYYEVTTRNQDLKGVSLNTGGFYSKRTCTILLVYIICVGRCL